MAEPEGFEPSIRYNPYDDLANRCLQPLGHSSLPKVEEWGCCLPFYNVRLRGRAASRPHLH